MTKTEIIERLRAEIIKSLYREDLAASGIPEDSPLFDKDGIGLDSLDAVELAALLESLYGVEVEEEGSVREIFATLSSLADYVLAKRKK